ncbi:VOC family protein [Humibacillus xanthopallidus]|uniref:Catechol 2,3-dioxygenase-like lactoylglutathione lyase family enzyme n=1 Tax=Humibacillus xanthopallidus TaxID=412689 RepID=A0A543HJB6_9MICO|nr:VOC family protein [Humibacillus xanthopallidus]TQM58415.1 catechol 2,3-dioxygenase-like lactoylglutathione lyase family enzyme [Humibacillus xanthopallidus]
MAVRYIVDDVNAAVAFYTEHLGFGITMGPLPGFAILTRGDLRLLLNEPGAGSAGHAGEDTGSPPAPGGWNRFQIEVTDLDETVETLRAAGVTFRGGVASGAGGRQILAEDPAGNPVELFEPPAR